MSRIAVPSFVGGSNVLLSPNASTEETINWLIESTSPSQGGKVQLYLRRRPGLQTFAQVAGQIDGNAMFYLDGRAYAVVGTAFVEVFNTGTTTTRGACLNDGLPATLVSNGSAGHQVLICSGARVDVFDTLTNVYTPDVLTGLTISMVEFMDGYFFAHLRNTRQVRYSDLEDGLTWPALSVFERSWGSDNISFLKRAGRQLWLIGTQTGEVWSDNGDPDLPFAPIPGVFLDSGCVAPFSAVRNGENGVIWLSQDERGGGQVVVGNSGNPKALSTYAIDTAIQVIPGGTRPGLLNAVGNVLQLRGHTLYHLQVDGLVPEPVLDLTQGLWVKFAIWNPTEAAWEPMILRSHMWAFERHLVGDEASGIIYELSDDYLSDGIAA